MSNWSTAQKVLQTIRAGDAVENVRGKNRCKVLRAANCNPPLDIETANKLGIKINVDWGEFLILLCHARGQLINAFLGNQYFFTVKIPIAPAEHQSEWESFITETINQILQDSEEFFELHNSRWSSVVAHGPGVMFWPKADEWLPEFCALSDLRIPTDTVRSFKNLNWFARRVMYTPMELLDEVFNDKPNNHWEKKAVAKIIKNYKELNFTDATNNYDIETSPEKYVEVVRQNGGFYGSDAVPAIPLFHFYFKDGEGWYMRVVPESGVVKQTGTEDDFLWKSDDKVAETWKQLIHCQHGDLSVDAPFKFHSERGLGYVLLEPTFYTNLTRCRMLQHVHDNFNIWLRSTDNAEKARNQVQEFGNMGVLKQGTSIVPQTERHQIQAGLVEMAFSQLKQLSGEASASYTQQADTGTQKEQTAFETRVKMEQVNAMMGSILTVAFKYEGYAHREICRRFCMSNSNDPDIQDFQKKCEQYGIPKDFLNVKYWRVEPVTPLGMGNPTIAQAAASQLLSLRPMMNPEAQNEVLHENILVITKDPRKAARWAPMTGKTTESDAKREAVGLFGTLMTGVPVQLSQSNLVDQIDALLPLFGAKLMLISKRNNMASQDEAMGLSNVDGYLDMALKQLSQDQQQKERVKQYGDDLGEMTNEMKALIQRGAEAQKKQAQGAGGAANAELIAKLRGTQAESQFRLRSKQAETAQTMRHREIEFQQEQNRKNTETAADIQREHFRALAAAHNASMTTEKE